MSNAFITQFRIQNLAQTDLHARTEGLGYTPDAEMDLLATVDGRSITCEVKTSWRSLRPNDLIGFAELALQFRPDIAMLAVMKGEQKMQA